MTRAKPSSDGLQGRLLQSLLEVWKEPALLEPDVGLERCGELRERISAARLVTHTVYEASECPVFTQHLLSQLRPARPLQGLDEKRLLLPKMLGQVRVPEVDDIRLHHLTGRIPPQTLSQTAGDLQPLEVIVRERLEMFAAFHRVAESGAS